MMLMNDLELELSRAMLSVSQLDFQRLKAGGFLSPGLFAAGWRGMAFGLASVAEGEEGLFYPSDGGRRSLILPVVEDGELADLVAVRTDQPDNWLLRKGLGSFLGLPDGLSHTIVEPLPVARNPVDWLKGGAGGLCVVDWTSPDLVALNDLPGFIVEDIGVERRLRAALTRQIHIAPIYMKEAAHGLAA